MKALRAMIIIGNLMLALVGCNAGKGKTEESNKVKVGESVSFGSYEQDNDTTNGKEDVEWIVLEVKDGKALLISKYALDYQVYNEVREEVSWETCDLREWLNHEFLNEAFSETEKNAIPTVKVPADENPYSDSKGKQGNQTEDQIFVLSVKEFKKYFSKEDSGLCIPTEYAKSNCEHDLNSEGTGWWLRTIGDEGDIVQIISREGAENCITGTDNSTVAVRPALWIDLSADIF